MNPSLRLRRFTALFAISGAAVLALAGATSSAASTAKTAVQTTTAATTQASSAPTCGGEVVDNSDGSPMTCTFDDEFDASTGDATALDTSKWVAQLTANSGYTTGTGSSRACYVNNPSTVQVADGYLDLSAIRLSSPVKCASIGSSFSARYEAGMVSTYGLFDQTYGEFEVRAELPPATAKGLQETLWLFPQNPKEYGTGHASGEIDFAEFYSQYSNLDVPYIHYNYTKSTAKGTVNQVTSTNCTINYGQFNTYGAIWQPGEITTLINGNVCFTDDYVPNGKLKSPEPFDQPFFIALTQAVGITTNAVTASTPLPATTQIDYVRAWK